MTLQERIAEALGWKLQDVQSFSFQSLRELVRTTHPKLAHELTEAIQSGAYVQIQPMKRTQEGQALVY